MGAICKFCNQDMLTADDCPGNRVITNFEDGIERQSIPYFSDEKGGRCPDCNCLDGYYHHPGCDQEECPRCGGQLISCSCLDLSDFVDFS